MSLLERAATDRRVTPLSLLGLILVPLAIAGLLVWAFWNPQERMDQVRAAIVNDDQPVTVNGQVTPLGRQLAAGLVGASDDNYTWSITDADDAAEGLADGTYAAVVTIPEDFSAAATSVAGDPSEATRATIDVATSDRAKLADDAISAAITSTAASVFGEELTTAYLGNVYLGFTTLGDSLAQATDGATQLADGTAQLAANVPALGSGARQLASGASDLSAGVSALASGTGELSAQSGQLTTGAQGLASGLTTLASGTAALPGQIDQLRSVSAQVTGGLQSYQGAFDEADALAQRAQAACPADQLPELCALVGDVAAQVQTAAAGNQELTAASGAVTSGLSSLSAGTTQLADGAAQSAAGASQLAAGSAAFAAGAGRLASGTGELASGAAQLADGAAQLSSGVDQLAAGTAPLADGAASLADGLGQAASQVPRYTDSESRRLSEVVARPVGASGGSAPVLFGGSAAPLAAGLALWLGSLATFVVLRPIPSRALSSTRGPLRQAWRGYWPAAAIGLVQGALVATILQFPLSLSVGGWIGLVGACALAAAAFAAVNQALVAVLGGAGRFIAMLVAVVALATGVVSTVPGALTRAMGVLPIQPAQTLIDAVVSSGPGVAAGITGLAAWGALSLGATALAVARARVVSVGRLRRGRVGTA